MYYSVLIKTLVLSDALKYQSPDISFNKLGLYDYDRILHNSLLVTRTKPKLSNPTHFSIQHSLHTIRGGGGNEYLDRAGLRISGFEEYGLISAFLLAIAVDLMGNTEKTWPSSISDDNDTTANKLFTTHNIRILGTYIFLFLTTSCVMLALYSTVIFALLGLYSKTCLGLNMDIAYNEFTEATTMIRYRGFNSFLASLGSLILSFLLSLFLNNEKGHIIFTLVIILSTYVLKDTLKITSLASSIVYNR